MIPPPRLIAITDRRICGEDRLVPLCRTMCNAGLPALMLREKDMEAEALLGLARELRAITAAAGTQMIVNGCIDTAFAVGADGVQVGHLDRPWAGVRRRLPPGMLMGASCHSAAELEEAAAVGADFALLSPVYTPTSKASPLAQLGMDGFRSLAKSACLPVLALGGITAEKCPGLVKAGAHGIAGIGCFFAAADPCGAVRQFLLAL